MAKTTICDFCRHPEPKWEYPARDFAATMQVVGPDGASPPATWRSQGSWFACNVCSALIETGELATLSARADAQHDLIRPEHLTDEQRGILRTALLELHEAFAAARTGERRPL